MDSHHPTSCRLEAACIRLALPRDRPHREVKRRPLAGEPEDLAAPATHEGMPGGGQPAGTPDAVGTRSAGRGAWREDEQAVRPPSRRVRIAGARARWPPPRPARRRDPRRPPARRRHRPPMGEGHGSCVVSDHVERRADRSPKAPVWAEGPRPPTNGLGDRGRRVAHPFHVASPPRWPPVPSPRFLASSLPIGRRMGAKTERRIRSAEAQAREPTAPACPAPARRRGRPGPRRRRRTSADCGPRGCPG